MDKQLTKIEKLDKLLLEFKDLKIHNMDYLRGLLQTKGVLYSLEEIKLALRKLIDDKYIDDKIQGQYKITFEGDVFIGYVKQRILQEEELDKISRNEIEMKNYQDRLFWATLSAGIAAALLLLWQVWIWFYPVHVNYPYWFWQ